LIWDYTYTYAGELQDALDFLEGSLVSDGFEIFKSEKSNRFYARNTTRNLFLDVTPAETRDSRMGIDKPIQTIVVAVKYTL
jgi:hypothetical protein